MNESMRDDSSPSTPTAAASVQCPRCNTRLRLLRPATAQSPISCCACGNTFYLQPVETAPAGPLGPPAPGPRPALRVVSPDDRTPRPPADGPPLTLSSPAPPAPTPSMYAAPGMPRRVEVPGHMQPGFRTRRMESVLGAALVLLFVVAVCAGGFVLWRTLWPAPDKTPAAAAADKAAPDAAADSEPAAEPVVAAHQPLPRPDRLVGTWESRMDDGSHSSLEFRRDGTILIAQAGNPPPPVRKDKWYLAEQQGDELVIEVGSEFGAAGNYQFVLRLTSPTALTVVRTLRLSIVVPAGENLRYVRSAAGDPPPAAAPR